MRPESLQFVLFTVYAQIAEMILTDDTRHDSGDVLRAVARLNPEEMHKLLHLE